MLTHFLNPHILIPSSPFTFCYEKICGNQSCVITFYNENNLPQKKKSFQNSGKGCGLIRFRHTYDIDAMLQFTKKP